MNTPLKPTDISEAEQELRRWEEGIASKDSTLKNVSGTSSHASSKFDNPRLPPVRGRVKSEVSSSNSSSVSSSSNSTSSKEKKAISGYDFRAWEKFDVDKAVEDFEAQEAARHQAEAAAGSLVDAERRASEKRSKQYQKELAATLQKVNAANMTPLQRSTVAGNHLHLHLYSPPNF